MLHGLVWMQPSLIIVTYLSSVALSDLRIRRKGLDSMLKEVPPATVATRATSARAMDFIVERLTISIKLCGEVDLLDADDDDGDDDEAGE